jgi:hypothetical protein
MVYKLEAILLNKPLKQRLVYSVQRLRLNHVYLMMMTMQMTIKKKEIRKKILKSLWFQWLLQIG